MNISKKFALALGAALCIGASAWAEPSIAVNRVQQRYPWNGNVDIDYTVSGVDDPNMFHVEFTLSRSDGSEVKMSSFSNIEQLMQAPNGKRRATWESARDGQKFFDANATLHATLVADGGNGRAESTLVAFRTLVAKDARAFVEKAVNEVVYAAPQNPQCAESVRSRAIDHILAVMKENARK